MTVETRDGTIHLPPDSILSRYLGADTICIAIFFFFLRISFLQVLRFDIAMCCEFLFLTLNHGKKLKDTLNIQTVTIKKKKHLSSHYCDSILQFTVICICLLKTRQWKIVDYTLKRDCIWWVILTKTMHHIFLNFNFRSIHIHSVYLKYLEPWNFKVPNPELAHECNNQMFNKMSRQNTFWNKIKCYVILRTVLVMFSRQLGFKMWRCRKKSGRGLILSPGFAFSRLL